MPIQIQLDLESRSELLQSIAADIIELAESEDQAGSMAYNLEDTVKQHEELEEDYEQLIKHVLTETFKELVNLPLRENRLGAIYALEDVKVAKTEVRKAVTNEVRAALEAE